MAQTDTIINIPLASAETADTSVELPQYYRETFFSGDSMLHAELPGGRPGVSADLVPYTVATDDVLVGALLGCLLLTAVVVSYARYLLSQQFTAFFYIARNDDNSMATPGGGSLCLLTLQCCLMFAFISYFYVSGFADASFLLEQPYQMVGIFFAVFIVYFLLRFLVYAFVNTVFFDSKKNIHWLWSLTYVATLEGIALFPAVVLHVFAGLNLQSLLFYVVFVLILAKFLTFYKCWVIFFRQNSFFLQNILYFCALEITPLLTFGCAMVLITNSLKINF